MKPLTMRRPGTRSQEGTPTLHILDSFSGGVDGGYVWSSTEGVGVMLLVELSIEVAASIEGRGGLIVVGELVTGTKDAVRLTICVNSSLSVAVGGADKGASGVDRVRASANGLRIEDSLNKLEEEEGGDDAFGVGSEEAATGALWVRSILALVGVDGAR